MANLPPSRPVIGDAEWRNGTPALATTARKLAEAVEYARRDARWWPSDPKELVGWSTWANPRNSVAADLEEQILGTALVPEPRGPHSSLAFRAYLTVPATDCNFTLRLYSSRGLVSEQTFLASNAWGQTSGWASFSIPFPPVRDILRLHLIGGAGTYGGQSIKLLSWSAWWTPGIDGYGSQIAVPAGGQWEFVPVAQNAIGYYDPLSTAVMRALALSANAYAACHVPMVAAKWLGPWMSGGSGALPGTPNLGRYRMWLRPRVPSVVIQACVKGSVGSLALQARLYQPDGTAMSNLVSTGNVLTTSYQWVTLTVDGLTPRAGQEVELRLADGGASGSVQLASLAVYESSPTAVNLGLAAGDTVPSTCPAMPSIVADAAMQAADLATIGRGLVWMHAQRRRALVDDSRFLGVGTAGYSHNSDSLVPPVVSSDSEAAYSILGINFVAALSDTSGTTVNVRRHIAAAVHDMDHLTWGGLGWEREPDRGGGQGWYRADRVVGGGTPPYPQNSWPAYPYPIYVGCEPLDPLSASQAWALEHGDWGYLATYPEQNGWALRHHHAGVAVEEILTL